MALILLAAEAEATEAHSLSSLQFAQLKYEGGNWNPRPRAVRRLLFETQKRTSIVASAEVVPVSPTDSRLETLPFLYWTGEGAPAPLPEAAVASLRRYLKAGGMIFVDAADDAFDEAVRRDLARILPDATVGRIPDEHVLYKAFYLIPSHGGRVLKNPFLEGVVLEDRLALVLSSNDHGGAWARDDFGRFEFEVNPGGEAQREMAFRLGINVLMYALCLDYKEDQVHIPFIMKRRR